MIYSTNILELNYYIWKECHRIIYYARKTGTQLQDELAFIREGNSPIVPVMLYDAKIAYELNCNDLKLIGCLKKIVEERF